VAEDMRSIADRRFDEALRSTGARDPREFYRETLKELREKDPDAYRRGVEYFETRLLPRVAKDDTDPIGEWLEYGRLLAMFRFEGDTVQIDPSGVSTPYAPPVPLDHLVIHLPTSSRERGLAVGLPPTLSAAQRAAFELLVQWKTG